jgi:flagellar hook-associated protein 2
MATSSAGAPISSPGIGSGLNVTSIVSGLMSIEQQPLTAVNNKISAYQTQISAYGSLKSALSTFQTSVSSLSDASSFNAQTATSSDASVTATADGTATLGNYAMTVSQLAKPQKLSLAGFANTTDIIGTGTLTISFGNYTPATTTPPATGNTFTPNAAKSNVAITIDNSNNTLAGIRDAINASNSSVSATIMNDGSSNHLVITSKDTGEVNSLKISVTDSDGNNTNASGLSQLAYDPTASVGNGKNLTEMQAAQDAKLNIDGIAIVKASNTITDAISGVTFNLLSTSGSNAVNLGVASNKAAVQSSVTSFVNAYNALDTTLRNLTLYDPTGKNSGPLLGDATTRSVINQIKSVMTKSVTSSGAITSLSQIGVSFQATGQLALDSTKLSSAMASNFSDIATLFTTSAKATDPQITYLGSTNKTQSGTYAINVGQLGTGTVNATGTINGVAATSNGKNLVGAAGDSSEGLNVIVAGGATGARGTITYTVGYASQLNNIINNLLSSTGALAARTDGMNSSIARLNTQADTISARLSTLQANYLAQYTKLDTLISSMNTTSSFLTQQIAAINANGVTK